MASKLSMDDVRLIERSLGRKPNALEEELFQAMWSEHCSYRHTKPLLRDLPNDNERTLAGPGEGAGAVRLQSGYALVFKLESHNHPSYIDPYEGAATGVGGILRDVFSMGARPLVVAGALTLAPSHQQPSSGKGNGDGDTSPDVLGREVIRGFQAYNETFGVVSGALHVQLDERYAHNPLVNVMAIGVVREEKLVRSKVSSPGLQLIYAGKSADHAGLGGAAFASAARSEHREAEGGVPRAYPDIGKRLFQATDTLIQNGLVQAMQDMGAAGLLSASVEMAAKSGLGVQLFLERVPRENDTVDARAMLLGETQERMLYAVRAEDAPAVLETIASFQLEGAVIGEVIQDDRYVARWEETVLVDVPASFLSGGVPLVDLRLARREKLGGRPADGERSAREGIHAGSGIDRTATEIDRSSLLSRVYEQTLVRIEKRAFPAAWPLDEEAVIFEEKFDEKEERQTVKTSGERGGPAEGEVRQAGPLRFAYALEQSAHTVERDPYRGTAKLVARAALKLALSGSTPLALTNNLNFGDPGDPVVREEIVESVRGMGAAARALNTPVVSGNVSLYNATDDRSIPPNPVIGMVGEIWSENDQPNDQPNDQTKKDVLIALVITLGEPEHYDRFLPLLSTLRDLVGRGVIVRAALWPESDEDPATGLLETLCYWLLDDEAAYTLELEALDRLFRSRIEDDALTAIGVLMRVNGARIVSFEHAMGELPAALASEVQWHTCGSVEREEVPGVTVRLHEMYRTCRREDVLAALERGGGRW